MKTIVSVITLLLLIAGTSHADGLLIPSNPDYPDEFMRNRLTQVSVTTHGLIAETVVYHEFVNQWDQPTNAVYAFPLPPDARATLLLYNRGEILFRAILQVQEQTPNPGTGEGGVSARVEAYLGRNVIRLELQDIPPGAVQKIELHYISLLEYHQGTSSYTYPLDTGEFITYPIDHLEFNFDIQTPHPITRYDIPSHPEFETLSHDEDRLQLQLRSPKSFLAKDLHLEFDVDIPSLGVDFFSVQNDSLDGHFALFLRPEDLDIAENVQPKRIVFLLNNSSRMIGFKLDQSIQAISEALDRLNPDDMFNLFTFNSTVRTWQNNLVPASASNIESAKNFLAGITGSFGNQMNEAIITALRQFDDANLSNSILIFSDGRSPIDPRQIALENEGTVGIFPIGIGEDLSRARLEMTAALNYGFVSYVDAQSNLKENMLRVFEKINSPILREPVLTFDKPDIRNLNPQTLPAIFAGAPTFITGRYNAASSSTLQLTGQGTDGELSFDFPLDFSNNTQENNFAALLWAKETIDALEHEVEVYGETPVLKDSVIALSLRYNIRSRYTAYVADYETEFVERVSIEDEVLPSLESRIAGNYPNPFSTFTTIRIYIDHEDSAKTKLLKIYNILGQLVMVIDLSNLTSGWHEIPFDGRNMYGQPLPSGLYLARLQVHNRIAGTIRMHLAR